MPKNARELAWETLSRWTVPHDPPRVPERDDPAWLKVAAREGAQGFELITGIIRWRGLLDAVAAAFLKQPPATLDAGVRAALWIGMYPLFFQDSVKTYAAVDEAVELCKTRGLIRASGLVNAVLRNILRAGPKKSPRGGLSAARFPRDLESDIVFGRAVLPPPQPLAGHLAAATSHPVEYVAMLLGQLPFDGVLGILIADNRRPDVVLRSDDPAFVPPADAGLFGLAGGRYFAAGEGWNERVGVLVRTGALSPQDSTAGIVAEKLAALLAPGAVVCDLCAGLGTKTIQLARRLPQGRVVATDLDAAKLKKLQTRVVETKVENVTVAELGTLAAQGPFDAVLVDAPCSNTGVLARRVQARWRWPKLDAAAMTRLQLNLLTQAAELCRPGGHVAYATCSIDAAENVGVIKRFMAGAAGPSVIVAEQTTWPGATHDGGYHCLLRR